MTPTHYVRRRFSGLSHNGNVITLPQRHRPQLELVRRDYAHNTDRLARTGLGRKRPRYGRDWLLVAILAGLYVTFCYVTRA